MKQLTPEQVNFFEENGYLIVPGVLQQQTLTEAQQAYWRILEKCRSGAYSEFRVENQMSDNHVFGIERIFNPAIYEQAIFDASIESGVLEFSKQIIHTERPFIVLNRIHCTNDFSYSGPWHRDGKIGQTDHIQSAICLYPEARFFVVPGSHKRTDADEKIIEGQLWSRKHLARQRQLSTNAGDLLLFHSSILHRGSSVGRGEHHRAYIHYRIGKIDFVDAIGKMLPSEYSMNPSIWKISPEWDVAFQNTLDSKIPRTELIQRPRLQKNLRGIVKKIFYRFAYYALSFLPEDHDFFTLKPNFTPYLRAPKRPQ